MYSTLQFHTVPYLYCILVATVLLPYHLEMRHGNWVWSVVLIFIFYLYNGWLLKRNGGCSRLLETCILFLSK